MTQDTYSDTLISVQRIHLKADISPPLLVPTQTLVDSPRLTSPGPDWPSQASECGFTYIIHTMTPPLLLEARPRP